MDWRLIARLACQREPLLNEGEVVFLRAGLASFLTKQKVFLQHRHCMKQWQLPSASFSQQDIEREQPDYDELVSEID